MQISAIKSVQGNEVKPLQPKASVDGPLSLPLSLSAPLSLSFCRTNIEANWHKHTALPFSNISCLLLFLWMHFNRYENPHTHMHFNAHTQGNSSFQIFSAYTKKYCQGNVFIKVFGSHRSYPARKKNCVFIILSCGWVYVFRYFHTICVHTMNQLQYKLTVLRCWVSVTHSFAIIRITWLPIWIAQGHSFLRRDLAIQIPTQCCNSFSSDSERACQSRTGIIRKAPVQKIMLYTQNVKLLKILLDFYHSES